MAITVGAVGPAQLRECKQASICLWFFYVSGQTFRRLVDSIHAIIKFTTPQRHNSFLILYS